MRLNFLDTCQSPVKLSCVFDHDLHYNGAIISVMASQITGVSTVRSTVCSVVDQRKHQSSASLDFVSGHLRWSVDSFQKGQECGNCLHLMTSSCYETRHHHAMRCVNWIKGYCNSKPDTNMHAAKETNLHNRSTSWWCHQMETFSA